MAFPEFVGGKKGILFFSRGRGRGHAIPDLEIVREILKQRDDVDIRFVSYGTGARTIEEFGFPLIDLGLPDLNPITETTVLAGKLIGWLDPDLVVSHEEFPALPAAKIFDKPTIFLTDFFVEPEKYSMQTLKFADEVLYLDDAADFDEPPWLSGKVRYVGPVLRRFEYGREDRGRAREELSIPAEGTVIAVLPGSWTEERAPIADLVLEAYDSLPGEAKRLIWIAGEEVELLREKTRGRDDVILRDRDWRIDRIMVAGDVAITKANRVTALELTTLGIPSVALCPGINEVDEARVERMEGVSTLHPDEATPQRLAATLSGLLAQQSFDITPRSGSAASDVASRISAAVDK